MLKEFTVEGIKGLDHVAKYIIELSDKSKVFYLKGDLGARKTTLVQQIGDLLGTKDQIVSPSFALVNIYKYKKGEIYHIDLYRLNDMDEAIDLGIEDYLYSDNFCFIEWPQIIENISPDLYFEINIEIIEKNKRKITIESKEAFLIA
jgi:tRNA threonylcarbamoyladenosine biosynthesis protein TsaE